MSSGCGDVLSLEDLKTAKLHQIFEAEVITGLSGGAAGGGPIDYATNPVTGQTQKTLPAILRDAGFRPASFTFTQGGTLNPGDSDVAVLWPVTDGGDGAYYVWKGDLPKTIPANSTPFTTGGVSSFAWSPTGEGSLRQELLSPTSTILSLGYTKPASPSGFNRKIETQLVDVINVNDFLPNDVTVLDGSLKTLADKFGTLIEAQAKYPFATSLSDSLAWAGLQAAVNTALLGSFGGQVNVPKGKLNLGNKTITATLTGYKSLKICGQGSDCSQIKYTSSGSALSLSYTASGWWIDATSANGFTAEDLTILTNQVNSGNALSIDGGALSGRPTRATHLSRVTFRGENALDQCFARSVNLTNVTYLFATSCRFFQALTGGLGIGIYARAVQADASNSQVCGGYYLTQTEFIYGDAGIDLSSYTEGVYLTNCVSDGGIKYGLRWLSTTAESGLQVTGGQFSASVSSFRVDNIIHGCFTGVDIRTNGTANWRGIWLTRSHGFNISGCNFVGAAVTGLMGVLIDNNSFTSEYNNSSSGNKFESLDYGHFLTATARNNHVDSSNVYGNVAIPVNDVNIGQNIVIKRIYTFAVNLVFGGGAATESKLVTFPANFLQASQKAECVFAKGSNNDLIGTYLYSDAQNTAVAALISFRLTTGGNIPAGTYRIMVQVS